MSSAYFTESATQMWFVLLEKVVDYGTDLSRVFLSVQIIVIFGFLPFFQCDIEQYIDNFTILAFQTGIKKHILVARLFLNCTNVHVMQFLCKMIYKELTFI